jgi:hypothetical protein
MRQKVIWHMQITVLIRNCTCTVTDMLYYNWAVAWQQLDRGEGTGKPKLRLGWQGTLNRPCIRHARNQPERAFYCFCGSYFSPGTYTVILVWRMMLAPANTPIAVGSMMRHWSVAHRVDRDSYTGRTLPRQEWGRPSWPTTSRDALTSDTFSCFQDGTDCHKNFVVSAKQKVHVNSHVFSSATKGY